MHQGEVHLCYEKIYKINWEREVRECAKWLKWVAWKKKWINGVWKNAAGVKRKFSLLTQVREKVGKESLACYTYFNLILY